MQGTTAPLILIHPLKPALVQGVPQTIPVLLRVQAPDPDPTRKAARKPYHLALVIDRSGSMSGIPLIEAVRCAKYIVDRLDPTDLASLVVFDDRVKTLAPASAVGDRTHLYTALAQIRPGGSTNLHGGWTTGLETLLPQAHEAALARVILLSDGNANVGETVESDEIATLCAEAAARGVTTSTYGLGRNFNEDLMVAMAVRGTGNHYYGDTAADLFEPFAQEFDLISSLHARHVRLSLAVPQGITITQLNNYPIEEQEGFPRICLPDMAWGSEAWVLLELQVPETFSLDGPGQLLRAAVTARGIDGAPISFQDATLTLNPVSAQDWEALPVDPLVKARQSEIEVGRLLEMARTAAEVGDWETIQAMIEKARARFAEHPWLMEVLSEMADLAAAMDSARFRKEALYSSRSMHSRLSAKEELLLSLASESNSARYLRRKRTHGKPQPDGGNSGR